MLPPIWVAACDSQRRRNAALRKTATGAPAGRGRRAAVRLGDGLGRSRGRARAERRQRRASWPHRRARRTPTSRRSSAGRSQQDVPATALAAQPDVGAEPVDQPGVAAARVRAAQPHDVAEEQREHGSVGHRRVRVSKARVAVGRDEVAGRSPAARCGRCGVTVSDDVGLGRGELGDDPARAGQRAGQLVRRRRSPTSSNGRSSGSPSTVDLARRPDHDDARHEPDARRRRSPRRRRCAAR